MLKSRENWQVFFVFWQKITSFVDIDVWIFKAFFSFCPSIGDGNISLTCLLLSLPLSASPPLSLSLSPFIYFCNFTLLFSVSLFLSISLFLFHFLWFFFCPCTPLSLCFSLSSFLSFPPSIFHFLCFFLCLSLSLSMFSLSVSHSLFLCLFLWFSPTLSFSVSLSGLGPFLFYTLGLKITFSFQNDL